MFTFSHHPAIKVTRVNKGIKANKICTVVNPLTEPKPKMINMEMYCDKHQKRTSIKFRHFTETKNKTNVHDLVNSELYARVSLITGDTIRDLKSNFTPQQMRAFLLNVEPKRYQDTSNYMYDTVSLKKNDYSIKNENKFEVIDNDVIEY